MYWQAISKQPVLYRHETQGKLQLGNQESGEIELEVQISDLPFDSQKLCLIVLENEKPQKAINATGYVFVMSVLLAS